MREYRINTKIQKKFCLNYCANEGLTKDNPLLKKGFLKLSRDVIWAYVKIWVSSAESQFKLVKWSYVRWNKERKIIGSLTKISELDLITCTAEYRCSYCTTGKNLDSLSFSLHHALKFSSGLTSFSDSTWWFLTAAGSDLPFNMQTEDSYFPPTVPRLHGF